MKYIPILVLFCLLKYEAIAKTLFISYSIEGDEIVCIGKLGEQIVQVEADLKTVINLSKVTYEIVERKNHKQEVSFDQGINELSENLLGAFNKMIEDCSRIIITIDKRLVKIPFEYFRINKIELNFYKPLIFRLLGTDFSEFHDLISINTGTIVRDKNCDPQNACKTIKKLNPRLKIYSSKLITPDQLSGVGEDVLLISAHGYAYEKNRGVMGWNKTPIKKELLKQLSPKITYFDSCQQGINLNYLEALNEAEGLNYYIAPIISNDSGDSSTRTIEWFFEKINTGFTPDTALLETKKKLNARYRGKRLLTRYNKSLSFRIYEL